MATKQTLVIKQPANLPIWDQRVFEFIDHCKKTGIKGVQDDNDFIALIGIKTLPTLYQVRTGKSSFTLHHLQSIGTVFGVSMDYLLGFSDQLYRNYGEVNPVELLQYVTRLISDKNSPLTVPLTKGLKKPRISKK